MNVHSFVPADFCFGMIVPLLKDKHGDASRLDIYRGITMSSTVSTFSVCPGGCVWQLITVCISEQETHQEMR